MLRRLLDTASLTIAWVKRGRRLRFRDSPVKVNLGSALAVVPGWINIDASLNALIAGLPSPLLRLAYRWSGSRNSFTLDEYCRILQEHRFVHHNFQYRLPLADESVDFVYSSHLLEHLFRDEALALLREIRRVLKPGGWVRVCVPDLSHAVSLLMKGDKIRGLEYFFAMGQAGRFNRHQYMYDEELLGDAFRRAAFAQPLKRRFRDGQVPDLGLLDNRSDETLYMEAQKTGATLHGRRTC